MIHAKNRSIRRVTGTVGIENNQNEVTVDDSIPLEIADGSEIGIIDASNVRISPANEHSTAASPHSARLSDGSVFYNALTDTQIRATALPVTSTGNVAHGATDSGNPVKIGAKAVYHNKSPTAVDENDRTNFISNIHGIPWFIGGHPNIMSFRANYTSAETDKLIVTISTGLKIVVTRIMVCASNANTVNTSVIIGFGSSTTPTGNSVIFAHPGMAAGGIAVVGSGTGLLGVGGDGEDLRATTSVPTTGSIDIVVNYYTIEA